MSLFTLYGQWFKRNAGALSFAQPNCQQTWGDFDNSNVFINCDKQWECMNSYWSLDTGSTASFNCTGTSSCRRMKIFAYDATSIDIECKGDAACIFSDIECPSSKEDACKINCDGSEYVCRGIDFFASEDWILQYLDITCDPSEYTTACDTMELTCEFDTGSPVVDILYDSNGASCNPNNYIDCCPFNTYSPTPRPTDNPTTVPTNEPSLSPSNMPSVSPTKNPTDEPTAATQPPTSNSPTTGEPTSSSPTTDSPTTSEPSLQTTDPGDGEESNGSNKHILNLLLISSLLVIYGKYM